MVNNNFLKKCLICIGANSFLLMMLAVNFLPAKLNAQTDTFKTANQLIAQKKYKKAYSLLESYHTKHPKDLNSEWLMAQVKYFNSDYRQSYKHYENAVKNNPNNEYLKLDYIHSLMDMDRMTQADNQLNMMEQAGREYSAISLLRARQHYYRGDYMKALAHMKKYTNTDAGSAEGKQLRDEIELARAPKLTLTAGYLTDNQPLSVLNTGVKFEKYFNRYLTPYINVEDYHFMQNQTSDAPWFKLGNRLYFPLAGLNVNINAGVMRFPVKNETAFTGELELNEKLSHQFDIRLDVERVPYMDTKISIDSNITANRFAAMLNWHLRSWKAQAGFLNSTYPDNNNVYSAYAWALAPVFSFPKGQLLLGYSLSYSGANENRYAPEKKASEILAIYSSGSNIAGVYNPYFTPDKMLVNAVIGTFNVNLSSKVDISINANVGYASLSNPYFYLNASSYTNKVVYSAFSTETFVPYNGTFGLNYHIDKSWLLTAKYMYRSTYFFNSNYVSLTLNKAFIHREKEKPKKTSKTPYMSKIYDVENKLKGLYSCKNSNDLRNSVRSIRNQLVVMRDEQLQRKNQHEITPNSDEANLIQEHVDNLNEMISDIDNVNLNDAEVKTEKSTWLAERLRELSAIVYNASAEE